MPRLLLVARNPSLAFGLASASDDIIEVRPALVGRLAISPGMADVVVIEQEKPEDALATLDLIRAGGLLAPALLVASGRVEWASFDPGTRHSVAVLDPPITQDRLGQSVGSTNGLPDAPEPVEEPTPAEEQPEVDSSSWLDDEATPIALAAAAAPTAVDDTLPDGPEELEADGDPYATATHEDPAAAEAAAQAEAEEAARLEAEAAALAEAEAAAQAEAEEAARLEAEAAEEAARLEAEAAAEAAALAEAEAAAQAEADEAARLEAEAAAEAAALAEAEAEETARLEAEAAAEAAALAEAEAAVEAARLEAEAESESEVDSGILAIPTAAPLRQPEEIRFGNATEALPAVVLYDEEAELTVAEGTPSPSAIVAEPTHPVIAWQGPPRTDGRVYAEMASLVAASGELLADEDPADESGSAESTAAGDDPLHVDLSKVFMDKDSGLGASTTPEPSDDTHTVATDSDPSGNEAPAIPVGRPAVAVVDLREPLPEDPRSTPALVRALLSRSHEVYGVSEAGNLVVGDALARTGASAGALLLQDGDSWRVAAGEGLRRLEHRYVLSADSWLVTTIASRHKGVIIDRTDVARRPLAGAPLAAHKHLVAAPVRAVGGILLIARDDDPAFGERDLASLARLAEASAAILASAMDARQLARLLGDIRDQDDRAAADRIDYGV